MQIGLIGLGTMGANLARNAARNGAQVIVFNRTSEKTDSFIATHSHEGQFVAAKSIDDFLNSFTERRVIVLMVKAGAAVDEVIQELMVSRSSLNDGDIIIDAGNSHFADTERRVKELSGVLPTIHYSLPAGTKIHFLGMGVSGGEEGALHGPSMMPGGSKVAFDLLKPLLEKMSASDGADGKCVAYMGEGGSGHFVKMVH